MAYSAQSSRTLLHVSDMQFGAFHRFGKGVESLASRLIADLQSLTKEELVPPIDVIVLSGDFVETGMAHEFELAIDFVQDVAGSLGLALERVVMVPGNHDVNRKLCESYFLQREGEDSLPVAPFDPKWRPYVGFVQSLQPPDTFTPERPFGIHRFEELGITVAALNSTMRESHRDDDHYGWCGEEQLRWFAEQLEQDDGHARIAVVHHNVRARSDTIDAECLRDADMFTQLLGPHIDLVLHGHTHNGKKDALANGTLVLATGSAAVTVRYRPEEVGNQYHILSVNDGSVTRWARVYDLKDKRWVGDNSLSRRGDVWHEEIPVHTLIRTGKSTPLPTLGPELPFEHAPTDLLAEVEQINRVAHESQCRIVRRRSQEDPKLEYLLVFAGADMHPVGAIDADADRATLEAFDRTVHQPFQQRSPYVRSHFVHTGHPHHELNKWAASRGIILRTWTEYQNLLDLTVYTAQLLRELDEDAQYPQSLYLDQYYQTVDRFGQVDRGVHLNLADTILDWLTADEQRFGMVLGDAGFGKSFLIRRLAYRLLKGRSGLVPVVVTLRNWEKNHTIVEMVSQTVVPAGVTFQLQRFHHMFTTGRLVLLVDGYDEFAIRVGYDRAADQLSTFLQAMEGGAKVLLTTRPSHFRTRKQAVSVVFQDVLSHTRHQIYQLQPFDAEEQKLFLKRWFEIAGEDDADAQAERWMNALSAVDKLPELARTPRMLSFMVSDLQLEEIEAAGETGTTMTAAALYERLIGKWLSTESDKDGTGRAGRPRLTDADRWKMAEELAFVLWRDHLPNIGQALLEDVAGKTLDLPRLGLTTSQAAQEIGSRTLLVGEGEERGFAHQSVYEYLLARRLASALHDRSEWGRLGYAELSELTALFLRDLAPEDAARWIRSRNEGLGDA